jgi:hypothetical protein
VVLKDGYEWVGDYVQTLPDRGNSILSFDWLLRFDGDGFQNTATMKIKKVAREEQEKKVKRTGKHPK